MLSFTEVRQILGLTPYRLRNLIKKGRLRTTPGRGSWRQIPKDSVDSYLKQSGSALSVHIEHPIEVKIVAPKQNTEPKQEAPTL